MKTAFITSRANRYARRYFVYLHTRAGRCKLRAEVYSPILAALLAAKLEAS